MPDGMTLGGELISKIQGRIRRGGDVQVATRTVSRCMVMLVGTAVSMVVGPSGKSRCCVGTDGTLAQEDVAWAGRMLWAVVAVYHSIIVFSNVIIIVILVRQKLEGTVIPHNAFEHSWQPASCAWRCECVQHVDHPWRCGISHPQRCGILHPWLYLLVFGWRRGVSTWHSPMLVGCCQAVTCL
jgi:hypothetical protein